MPLPESDAAFLEAFETQANLAPFPPLTRS